MYRVIVAVIMFAACGRFGFVDEVGSWTIVDEFGLCSDSCTTGVQSRVVECRSDDGRRLADAVCDGAKPAAVRDCAETGCAWTTSEWDACSVNCGGGMQERAIECRTVSGLLAPDTYCTDAKPADAQACNSQACCADLGNNVTELPRDGAMACGTDLRYMIEGDLASTNQRCQELGYDGYGGYQDPFTFMDWCYYCNARTRSWDGSAWVGNGCNVGVNVLRCCDVP